MSKIAALQIRGQHRGVYGNRGIFISLLLLFVFSLTLNKSLCARIQMVMESAVLQPPQIGKVLCLCSQSPVCLCQQVLEVVGIVKDVFS